MKHFVLTIFVFVISCAPHGVISNEEIKQDFERNKNTYVALAEFMDRVGTPYDFVSLDVSEMQVRLTLGDHGVQTSRFVESPELSDEVLMFVKNQKGLIMKEEDNIFFQLSGTKRHGVQRTNGIMKSRSRSPRIDFSWVKHYDTERLEESWFLYSIN